MRPPEAKRTRPAATAKLCARVRRAITLEAHASGDILAYFGSYSVPLGTFGKHAAERVKDLSSAVPFASLLSGGRKADKEIDLLVRRAAAYGLVEYCLRHPQKGTDLVVVEPLIPDYWPRTPRLDDADIFVFSRFAYLRRHGNEMVLESPRAGALFKISDPPTVAALATFATPQPLKRLRRRKGFPGSELVALLADCDILCKVDGAGASSLRTNEGDSDLVLWDFHDLLFHARSTQGRHTNPIGGAYPFATIIPPLPSVRPPWPGKKIDLDKVLDYDGAGSDRSETFPIARILRERHSTRGFDDQRPITLCELALFLEGTARVLARADANPDLDDGGHTVRPYPSAGASYELELYLAVNKCDGLAPGFYHYDAGAHALMTISTSAHQLEALLKGAAYAMGVPQAPQILITIAARFGRVSWKYSSIAYSLILKNVGVLLQTFYLAATDMGLGGCAIGMTNIDLFAKLTGIAFHVEGPVGQFVLGRGMQSREPESRNRP